MMMARIKHTALWLALLLVLASVADASIKWRRVTKTTHASIHSTTTDATPSATKTAVTWRRSTLSRRSTTEQEVTEHVPEHEEEHEEEDIDVADSKEDISILEEDIEQEPAIRPLVPGSRPGFWFDSSRKRKPSALLRPGSRKSSLFPNKPSTLATPSPETDSPTPASVLPVTTPRSIHSPKVNRTSSSKAKTFGRNSSTRPPVAFKRRLKATKSQRTTTTTSSTTTTTTAPTELEKVEEVPRETDEDFNVKEKDSVSVSNGKIAEVKTKSKPYESVRLPGIRRRKNGTRGSWRKEGSRFSPSSTAGSVSKISRTTPIPDLKGSKTTSTTTTTTPVHSFTRSTRKPTSVSRVKSRAKLDRTSLPQRTRTKSSPPTTPAGIATTSTDKKPTNVIKGPTNYLRNRNVHKFNRLKPKPIPEESEEEEEYNVVTTTPEPNEEFEIIVNTTQEIDFHSKSTVEPFYITRDYGELVTAIPEIGSKKGQVRQRTTTSTPVTKEPEVIEEFETLKKLEVNDTKNDIDSEEKVNEEKDFKISTVDESFKYPESISRHSTQQQQRSTTPKPLPTIPPFSHTIDPGNNNYVVWSLGQGGSGWSYEKQGGQVKWSAQNSQAEGDRWSVQGTEEKGTSSSAVWAPTNSTSSTWGSKKSELITSLKEQDKKVYYPNDKSSFDSTNYWKPVTYMPKIPYRNETILKFTTPGDVKTLPPSDIKGFSPFPSGITDFSPIVFPNAENNILSDNFEHSVQISDSSEFTINPKFQNSRADGYHLSNENISQNNPNETENGVSFSFREDSNAYEPLNVSIVEDYLTETPQVSVDWNLPTTIRTPLEDFHGVELENQFSKSTNPSYGAEDITPYRITVPELGFGEEFPSTVDSPVYFNGGFSQQARDLSGIPPELAKAVVDAKRWTVVGTGGTEGWSLLGEDGKLEWKIHNIDGRWSVTSGDQLLKLPLQVPSQSQEAPNDVYNQKDNLGEENINEKSTLSSPKIWKLEDDYNKWKVLSAEGGIQIESPEDQLTDRGYDYDQNIELEDNYYDDEDEYDDIGGNNFTPPSFYEGFDDRPIWGTGEKQMIRRYPSGTGKYSTPSVGGGIESANTKEDAIAAWKSLLVDQGNWKVSKENFRENPRTTSSSRYTLTSPSRVSSDWKVHSTTTLKPKRNFERDPYQEYYPLDRSVGNNKEVQNNRVFQNGMHHNKNPELEKIDSYHVEEFEGNQENKNNSKRPENLKFHHKDHAKIDTLINKLENIQKGSKGRAVVDLSQLLKLIKTNRNSTSATSKPNKIPVVKSQTSETDFIPSRDKTVEYKKVTQQIEHSKQQIPREYDSNISSKIQYERQRGTYERHTNEPGKNRIIPKENFHEVAKEEDENSLPKINLPFDSIATDHKQISKGQILPVNKFDDERTYYKQLGNVNNRNMDDYPTHIRDRQNYKTSEESPENIHQSENNSNYPYSNLKNKQIHSNYEENADEQRTSSRKNNEKDKYLSDVDSSSEEYNTRRNVPQSLHNYREKTEDNTHRRIFKSGASSGTDNTFNDEHRIVQIMEPKRKLDEFQTGHGNSYLNDEANLENQAKSQNDNQNIKDNTFNSNTDSSEKYTISNKYHTSRNRRKRPKTAKYRSRVRGRPGHSKMNINSQVSQDSSSEKFSRGYRKRPQEPEIYQQNNNPEAYEDKIRPQRNEENRRPQRNEENRQSQRDEESRRPQRNEENRRPQKNEENRQPQKDEESRRPQRNEESRRPQKNEENRQPQKSEENRRPQRNEDNRRPQRNERNRRPERKRRPEGYDESRRPERYEERRHHERYEEKIHPNMYEEDRRHKENAYDSSPEFTAMTQRQKAKSNKYSQASPIVISSETEIEDDEDGSKKNRKIIVIDYAGRPKKKSPIDRKDLELIIRSVKNRRSEIMEDISSENNHPESSKGQ